MNTNTSGVGPPTTVLSLSAAVRREIVDKKATCPFLASAVATDELPVRNEVTNPLAAIDDVRRLGNTGGGNLGDLLVIFATGNHAYMRGSADRLDKEVPPGLFSLELPGSQGSHPGHSGILQGDPEKLASGHLSLEDFDRLVGRAEDGLLKRSAVGRFIAENLAKDPQSKVFGLRIVGLLARGLGELMKSIGPVLLSRVTGCEEDSAKAKRKLVERLTRVLGEDNLLGSAGEFGLLFAFLAKRPGVKKLDGEPTVSVDDLRAMFIEKRFPDGWENWKKTWRDWVSNTARLAVMARGEYRRSHRPSAPAPLDPPP